MASSVDITSSHIFLAISTKGIVYIYHLCVLYFLLVIFAGL
jgi:hypothetical protein